ncbi:phosphoglycerate dehydrogenase [Carboxydochorda subterranea]|uniref:Phosphoglycerate dehydrogenase n=1 Tax=Carboxydichorda subterranea TaxID=3109565 RepID=A0ABZ1BUR2_9FIRM|nr:phosphoglycerate dehydrogenase [Limnochorda sp. L945t]WRP16542.1 phosphoglycerate dehydrogenase [Limnochorda sp. L945t]
MTYRILVTSLSFGREDATPVRMLEDAGCEVIRNPAGRPLSDEELAGLVGEVDGIIAGVDWIGPRTLSRGVPRLRIVSRTGVGYDRVDVETATRLGVAVTITPGANSEAVADLAMGLLIAVARQIPEADRTLRDGRWHRYTGRELWRKRLGLVGLGRIGKGVARRAAGGFAMEVLAYDVVWDEPFCRQWGVMRAGSLDEIFETCDFISLHVPETAQTRHLVNEERLRRMKRTAYLVNTARGGLVDEAALARALQEGWIAGAALDVFEKEPPASSPLLGLPNVVVTPHIGAHTVEAVGEMSRMAARNLLALLVEGRVPEGLVNPEALRSGS